MKSPETDALLFSTRCQIGKPARSLEVELMLDTSSVGAGEDVDTMIEAGSKVFSFPARSFADSDEFSGLRLMIGRKSPVWSALAEAPEPRFGVEGGAGVQTATADGAAEAFDAFAAACLDDDAAPTPAIRAPVATGDGASAGPAAVAAPNPQSSGTAFACDDGSTLSIAVSGAPASRLAVVALGQGKSLSLTAVAAAFGEKFTNGSNTLRLSGATAQLTLNGASRICVTK